MARPDPDGALPTWVRYPLIVLFAAFVLTGLVILLYDRGWLPLAGPFVAVIVASTVVYLVMWSRGRQMKKLGAEATQRLHELSGGISRERSLPVQDRPSGATDQSLDSAAEQAELALQRLAWGHEQGAAPHVAQLVDTARRSWHREAPLTLQTERLAATVSKLDETIRRMVEAAERRHR